MVDCSLALSTRPKHARDAQHSMYTTTTTTNPQTNNQATASKVATPLTEPLASALHSVQSQIPPLPPLPPLPAPVATAVGHIDPGVGKRGLLFLLSLLLATAAVGLCLLSDRWFVVCLSDRCWFVVSGNGHGSHRPRCGDGGPPS